MKISDSIKIINESVEYLNNHKDHYLDIFFMFYSSSSSDCETSDATNLYFDFAKIFAKMDCFVKNKKINQNELKKNISKTKLTLETILNETKMSKHQKVDVLSGILYLKLFSHIIKLNLHCEENNFSFTSSSKESNISDIDLISLYNNKSNLPGNISLVAKNKLNCSQKQKKIKDDIDEKSDCDTIKKSDVSSIQITSNCNTIKKSDVSSNIQITSNITSENNNVIIPKKIKTEQTMLLIPNNATLTIDQILNIYSHQIIKQIDNINFVITSCVNILSELKRNFLSKINCLEMYGSTSNLDNSEVEYYNNLLITLYNQFNALLSQKDINDKTIFNNTTQTINIGLNLGSFDENIYQLFTIDNICVNFSNNTMKVTIGNNEYFFDTFPSNITIVNAISVYKQSFANVKKAIFILTSNNNILQNWKQIVTKKISQC
jgi:hypothetical protein